MGIDLMIGGMALTLARVVFAIISFAILWYIVKKYGETRKMVWFAAGMTYAIIAFVMLTPSNAPKRTIDVPALKYEQTQGLPDIVTPEARTKKLEGFTPLKTD